MLHQAYVHLSLLKLFLPRFKQYFWNKNVVLPFPANFQLSFSVSLPLKDNQPGAILIKGDIGLNCSI